MATILSLTTGIVYLRSISGTILNTNDGLATTSTDGFVLQNTTAATALVPVQQSPRFRFRSQVWNTTATAATNTNDWWVESVPVSGTTPSGLLTFGSSLNGAATTYPMTLTSTTTGTASGITMLGSVTIGASNYLRWTSGSNIRSPSTAGQFTFSDGASDTNGVGLDVNANTLKVRTLAQTGYATVDALQYNTSGANAITVSGSDIAVGNGGANVLITGGATNGILKWGATSAYPALKRSGTTLQARLGDDSLYATVDALGYQMSGIPFGTVANGNVAAATNTGTASIASYVVGAADGTFLVSANALVTTATTHSFSLDVTYTDESNAARTLILPVAQLAGAFITGGLITNVTGTGTYESPAMTIRAKATTTITVRTSAGGTYTSVVYNARGVITQVG